MLYFISRYLKDLREWYEELKDLKQRKFQPTECIFYKDDEKLSTLINNLLQEDPNKRLSAREAKEYVSYTIDAKGFD
jgi:hypothetical protein